MAFDPDKYLQSTGPQSSGSFDPDAFLESAQKESFKRNESTIQKKQEHDAITSFGAGARQGALLGYAPQVGAAIEPIVAKLYDVINGTDFSSEIEPYVDRRDKLIKKEESYRNANPGFYAGGNVAGAIATAAVPAALGAKAVTAGTAAGRIKAAAKAGAIYGAAQNPGDTEGEIAPVQAVDRAQNAAIGAATGAVFQGGAEGIGKLAKATKELTKKTAAVVKENLPTLKENAAEIIESARRQGIKVTPGMILKGDKFEALEASLAKSPSLFNTLGKRVQTAKEKVVTATEDALDDASGLSPYEVGQKVKSEIQKKFSDRLAPISDKFDEIAAHTKNADVSQKGVERVVKNIGKIDEVQLVEGTGLGVEGKVRQYSQMLKNVKNVDQLKKVGTLLQSEIKDAQGPDKQVLNQMLDKVRRLENRNIERAAIKSGQTSLEGAELGRELIRDLKGARLDYAALQGDAREFGKQVGVRGKNLSQLNQSLDDLTPEEVSKKFFNTGDEGLLNYLSKKYPEQFDAMRRGRIGKILKDSTSTASGEVLPGNFIRQINALSPNVRKMILGSAEKIEKASDIETLYQAMNSYRSFNPSGTGQANALTDMLWSTAKDIPRYTLYKGLSNNGVRGALDKIASGASKIKDVTPSTTNKAVGLAKSVSSTRTKYQDNGLLKDQRILDLISQNPELADGISDERMRGRVLEAIGRSPQSQKITKGESAWAAKGFENITKHPSVGSALDEATIERLFNSKRGRDLLNRASDINPESKAMGGIVKEIKKMKGEK